MSATRKLVPLLLGLAAFVIVVVVLSVGGSAPPAIAGPEASRDAAGSAGASVDAAASRRRAVVRDNGESSCVRVLDRVTRRGLEHAWLVGPSSADTFAPDGGGVFTLAADRTGTACTVGCPGYYSERVTVVGRETEVLLQRTQVVRGVVQFEGDASWPDARQLGAAATGRNVLDDGFVAQKFRVLPDYMFEFDSGQARSLDLTLRHADTREVLGAVTWTFPEPRVLLRARRPSAVGASRIDRRIVVQLDDADLSAWKERAARVDLKRVDLVLRESGLGARAGRGVAGGFASGAQEFAIRGPELSQQEVVFECELASGTFDIELRDYVLGTSCFWPGVEFGDEQREVTLRIDPRGRVTTRFFGVEAAQVSLFERPVYVQLLTRDGQVVARSYCADGTVTANADCVPCGRYYALALGESREHAFLRAPLVPCDVVDGVVTHIDVFLEPAGMAEVHADVGDHHGVMCTIDGVVVQSFELREKKSASYPLAPGSYVLDTGNATRRFDVARGERVPLHLPQ